MIFPAPSHPNRHPFSYALSLALHCEHAGETKPKAWPLNIITKQSNPALLALPLDLGQAVLFKGMSLPHYRDPLGDGHRVISVSFSWDAKNRIRPETK